MSILHWPDVWAAVAADLGRSWSTGLGRLVTEDVVRFATVKALVERGVPAERLESEWRRPGVPDSVDLVITGAPHAALEFKYPREPRQTNAPLTQHLGEVLKDFYRLAYMPADFDERWCVQLLSTRIARYITGVADRHGVHIAARPGHVTVLQPNLVRSLPATATGRLTRWLEDPRVIRARCVGSFPVSELSLVVHEVQPTAPAEGSWAPGETSA